MQTPWILSLAVCCVLAASRQGTAQRTVRACDEFATAVASNPNNLEAAVSLGRCSVRDWDMIAPNGDSTRLAFRSSWTTAIRALRHAVEIDPTYDRAYRPLFFILLAETRDGCSSVTGMCEHVSPVMRVADSIITIPKPVPRNGFPDSYDEVIRQTRTTQRGNLTEARAIAQHWAAAAPTDPRPHTYLGRALLRLDDLESAIIEFETARSLGSAATRREVFWDRLEALVRADRGAEARSALDEAAADPGRDTMRVKDYVLAAHNEFLGRSKPVPPDTSPAARARLAQMQAKIDSIRRNSPPPPPSFEALIAAGDTSGARRALAREDSFSSPRPGTFPLFWEHSLDHFRRHLLLGDTALVETWLELLERPFTDGRFRWIGLYYGKEGRPWSGRAWLFSGDLAAARGRVDEAKRLYRRVVGLWNGGDASVQPVVDTARARLNSLSKR